MAHELISAETRADDTRREALLLVSIVIITRNRPHILSECLRHVLTQEYPSFEVVVVDASDGDETGRLMRSYPQVRYVYLRDAANQMPRSRNQGLSLARGDVVAFIDDDSLVQPAWLQALVGHYADPRVGGVGGLVLAPGEEPRRDRPVGVMSRFGSPGGDFNVLTSGALRVEHLRGCNMSFRREVLTHVGGFDQRYDGSNFREETDLCVRVRRAGYDLVYDPNVAVIHLYARKDGYGRDDRTDYAYRFSVAKNTTYFRLKHFLTFPTIVSLLVIGPVRALISALLQPQNRHLAIAEIRGRLAGVRTYRASRRE